MNMVQFNILSSKRCIIHDFTSIDSWCSAEMPSDHTTQPYLLKHWTIPPHTIFSAILYKLSTSPPLPPLTYWSRVCPRCIVLQHICNQYPMSKLPFHLAIWLSPKLGDASTHLMVGCSYDDNGMVQHIVYIVHLTSTSTPHLLVTCLS